MFEIRFHVARHETIPLLFPRLTPSHTRRERTCRHDTRASRAFVLAHEAACGPSNRAHSMPLRFRLVRVRRGVRHPRIHDGVTYSDEIFFSATLWTVAPQGNVTSADAFIRDARAVRRLTSSLAQYNQRSRAPLFCSTRDNGRRRVYTAPRFVRLGSKTRCLTVILYSVVPQYRTCRHQVRKLFLEAIH